MEGQRYNPEGGLRQGGGGGYGRGEGGGGGGGRGRGGFRGGYNQNQQQQQHHRKFDRNSHSHSPSATFQPRDYFKMDMLEDPWAVLTGKPVNKQWRPRQEGQNCDQPRSDQHWQNRQQQPQMQNYSQPHFATNQKRHWEERNPQTSRGQAMTTAHPTADVESDAFRASFLEKQKEAERLQVLNNLDADDLDYLMEQLQKKKKLAEYSQPPIAEEVAAGSPQLQQPKEQQHQWATVNIKQQSHQSSASQHGELNEDETWA